MNLEPDNGKPYPKFGNTVIKWRNLADDGLRTLTHEQRQAYGTAVELAIRSLQRSEMLAAGSPVTPERPADYDLHEAIRAKQHASILACPGKIRRARTPHEWETLYNEAMGRE